jgi:hypothetical protein
MQGKNNCSKNSPVSNFFAAAASEVEESLRVVVTAVPRADEEELMQAGRLRETEPNQKYQARFSNLVMSWIPDDDDDAARVKDRHSASVLLCCWTEADS